MAGPLDGVEFPARAVVVSSAADDHGYRATLEVLDGAGERTGQRLPDLPLDRRWHPRDGAGQYGPPAAGVVLQVGWLGGSGGHPVVQGAAEVEPHAPAAAVPEGAWAHQDGEGSELRQHADGSWWLRNRAGAVFEVDVPGLWKLASTATSLHTLLAAMIAAGKAATTVHDTDTPAGSPGRELPLNAPSQALWDMAQTLLDQLLRP